jgi:hypothetical protein
VVGLETTQVNTAQSEQKDVGLKLINIESSPCTGVLRPQEFPDGLSMDPVTVQLNPGEARQVVLHFTVRDDTQVGQNLPLVVATQTTYDITSAQSLVPTSITATSSFSLSVDVFSRYGTEFDASFTLIDGSDQDGDGPVTCNTRVIIKPDGSISWDSHLEDSSAFYGDTYVIYFGLLPASEANVFQNQTGTLGAEFSGPSTSQDVHVDGILPADLTYADAAAGGVFVGGISNPDLSSLFGDALKAIASEGWLQPPTPCDDGRGAVARSTYSG